MPGGPLDADQILRALIASAKQLQIAEQATVWVDLDSGTILNGPVIEVPASIISEDMSDYAAIAAARNYLLEI